MTDPLWGRDGTQAVTDAVDALAPPPRVSRDEETLARDDVAPSALPALPSFPVAADHAAVARWMDADAAESRRTSGPGRSWIDGETVEAVDSGATSPGVVREAGPARLLPREASPAPAPRPPLTERTPSPPRRSHGDADGARDTDGTDDEPSWLRERREEHEFRSQFGEWRTGPVAPARGSRLSATTVLVLLALAAVLVLIALG